MKKQFFLLFIIILFALASCEEDELKLPAEVNVEFEMTPLSLDDDNAKGDPVLTVDEGYLVINTIEFDGDRDEGEDYFFSSPFEPSLQVELHNGIVSEDVTFDIPQGVYKKVEFTLMIGDEEYPALRLRGICNKPPFKDIPMLFEYPFTEEIQIGATNIDGKKEIVLTKDQPSTATIILDTPDLFKLFNFGMLQQAELVTIDDEDVLLINNETNTNIFNVLAIRLEQSMQVVFE
ncbi:MAG: hypothetical protein JW965_05800 [Bacteroidales bacterium]|nr:hypothetical protein [Bacteroidales bacterium]